MNSKTGGLDLSGNANRAILHDVTFGDLTRKLRGKSIRFHGRASSYLSVVKSATMDLSQSGGFAFTAFVKVNVGTAKEVPLIEWPEHGTKLYGLHILFHPDLNLFANLADLGTDAAVAKFDMKITPGVWKFIGVSYDKVSRKVIGYMDGATPEMQERVLGASYAPDTTSSPVLFGKRARHLVRYLDGEMRCAMLFNRSLTLDDMKNAKTFCVEQEKQKRGERIYFWQPFLPSASRTIWSGLVT
jgi:hypothetical protein